MNYSVTKDVETRLVYILESLVKVQLLDGKWVDTGRIQVSYSQVDDAPVPDSLKGLRVMVWAKAQGARTARWHLVPWQTEEQLLALFSFPFTPLEPEEGEPV